MSDTSEANYNGLVVRETAAAVLSPELSPKKADAGDFLGRFREIISDPINLLIERHPLAGVIENDLVYLHNGNRVPVAGPNSYYGRFSEILVINRGVHEPLEEFLFQEMIRQLPKAPNMLELGAYWGHYSMWLMKVRPQANVWLVEPQAENLETGQRNFDFNGFHGRFLQGFVGEGHFSVDDFIRREHLERLNILHADIQGFEVEMLKGCMESLACGVIDYLFISTHSQDLHTSSMEFLKKVPYRIEVSSDFNTHTTAFDGLIVASSCTVKPLVLWMGWPLGRVDICKTSAADMVKYLGEVRRAFGMD